MKPIAVRPIPVVVALHLTRLAALVLALLPFLLERAVAALLLLAHAER